jgi:hypothetical protein
VTEKILDKITKESGCTPKQVRHVMTLALRELHLVSATDPKVTTGAIMECRWNFGTEASFHLGGILTHHDDKTNRPGRVHESLIPETMARFLGCGKEIVGIKRRWLQYLDRQKSQIRRKSK